MDVAADSGARAKDGVVARPVEDRCVLVNLGTGACWELNRMGLEIWKLFEQGLPSSAVCAQLASRYGVELEVVTADVRALVQTLVREGLAEMVSPAPSPP